MALADFRKLAPGESPACSWRTETIMAKQVEERTIGVDVAKCWLDIYVSEIGELERIENTEGAIEEWLRGLPGSARIAIEATNRYHELFIERAHAQGHCIYVIDAFRLSRYRDAVGYRAKTDRHDAELLARYLQQEHEHLRRWQPYYQSLRDRGFSGTAALMALARKLVRVCYALLNNQLSFDPEKRKLPCNAT